MDEKGISELEAVNTLHLKQYVRTKYKDGLQPQSIVSMFKIVRAFFSWCQKEEYLKENIAKRWNCRKFLKITKGIYHSRGICNDRRI